MQRKGGPRGAPPPVLSVNPLLQNAARNTAVLIQFSFPPHSLSSDYTHPHLKSWQTGEGHPEQVMHTSSALCAEMRQEVASESEALPRLFASDRKWRRTRRMLLSSLVPVLILWGRARCHWVRELKVKAKCEKWNIHRETNNYSLFKDDWVITYPEQGMRSYSLSVC